jgi:transcriptional regulator with XRE-family HTH domain
MKNEFYREVGDRLRRHRRAMGLTQSDLASRLGLTFQQVQKYESGANRIPLDKLIESCRCLDIPPALFLRDAQEAYIHDEMLQLLGPLQRSDEKTRGKIGRIIHILAAD